ncbi:MAG: M16 family metallopeptidase [Bacteroidales bacterium]
MKKTVFILILLVTAATSLTAKTDIIKYKLDNGLTVILNPDSLSSEVFGMVVANVGAKHDPATATGLAHYMEHMLFKGTKEIGTTSWESEKPHIDKIIELYDELAATDNEDERQEIQQKINEASVKANEYVINNELWSVLMEMGGTNLNAGTGTDATMYFNSFPPGQIEKWLEIYSHRFVEPVFRGFQAELEVVYEEKNMYSDQFMWNLIETFGKNFFKKHPYGQQSIIGSVEHLKNPQLSKMIEFYETYYVANNMALVLVGNFDPNQIKPIIAEKFSRLKSGELPEPLVFEEEPFNGREFTSGRYSPIRLGIMGFRTAPKLHPDKIKLDIANGILSNSSSTGLLDQLMLNNKLMASMSLDMPYNDHGASLFVFIPKMFRQSLRKAESLVLKQLETLKKGEFDEELVDAIKLEKYRNFQRGLENYSQRAQLFADAFVSGEDLDVILDYPNRILDVTKEDIIEVANKYYGDNYLAFYSKMGSADTEKLEKPDFEPVVSNQETRSEYVEKLYEIDGVDVEYDPVDFENDIEKIEIKPNVNLHVNVNPINDIFSFAIRYPVGTIEQPNLKYLGRAMNYAGTSTMNPIEFKKEMGKIGCTYYVSSSNSNFSINISGPENNLPRSIELVNNLLQNTEFNRTSIKKIWEEERMDRKMEDSDPQSVAEALLEYAKYGENSQYINRLSKREVKRLGKKNMQETLNKLKEYEAEIHFVGNTPAKELAELIHNNLSFNESLKKGTSPIVKELEQYNENTVLFVNNKKAVQSNIHFFMNGKPYTIDNKAAIDAFNTYFGGSFSGIVMQEIREFRSLSYAASARYITPAKSDKETHFTGYVGTQADKTIEAIGVYNDLLRNLPEKPERMDMIRNYLTYSGQTRKPEFRNMSFKIMDWKNQGYTKDPYLTLKPEYSKLKFDTIQNFHTKFIKDKPLVIVIVGDEKRVDIDALKKFGKFIEIDQKDLYTK